MSRSSVDRCDAFRSSSSLFTLPSRSIASVKAACLRFSDRRAKQARQQKKECDSIVCVLSINSSISTLCDWHTFMLNVLNRAIANNTGPATRELFFIFFFWFPLERLYLVVAVCACCEWRPWTSKASSFQYGFLHISVSIWRTISIESQAKSERFTHPTFKHTHSHDMQL